MSYPVAVPVRLSSPVATQPSVAVVSESDVMLSASMAGRTTSGALAVVNCSTFESADQLPASSTVLIATQYVVFDVRPVRVTLCLVPDVAGDGIGVHAVAFPKLLAVIAAVE